MVRACQPEICAAVELAPAAQPFLCLGFALVHRRYSLAAAGWACGLHLAVSHPKAPHEAAAVAGATFDWIGHRITTGAPASLNHTSAPATVRHTATHLPMRCSRLSLSIWFWRGISVPFFISITAAPPGQSKPRSG